MSNIMLYWYKNAEKDSKVLFDISIPTYFLHFNAFKTYANNII